MSSRRLSITVDDDLAKRFDQRRADEGRSESQMGARLIKLALDAEDAKESGKARANAG